MNSQKIGKSFTSFVVPALIYFFCFYVYTFPLMQKFSSHFFTDRRDGLQSIWNLWWISKSLLSLHTSFWHTSFLHYPFGVDLYTHSLAPLKGLIYTGLQFVFTRIQSHNFLVMGSFVLGGLNAFCLCRYFTRSYIPSLAGGLIYAFSNAHMAHAASGHIHMISFEWNPLFLLLTFQFLETFNVRKGIAAAIVFFLISWSCQYYFFYAALCVFLIFLGFVKRTGKDFLNLLFQNRKVVTFVASLFLISVFLFIKPMLHGYSQGPLPEGLHDSRDYSMDLLSPLLPGGFSHYAAWTREIWGSWKGNYYESSLFVGFTLIFLLLYVLFNRKSFQEESLNLWLGLAGVFAIFALGPQLNLMGRAYPVPLPYAALEYFFPAFKLSGIPARMFDVTQLSLAVIGAMALRNLWRGPMKHRVFTSLLMVVLFFEYWPARFPGISMSVPESIRLLQTLPPGAMIDTVSTRHEALYYQTLHEKPMAFGYLSRVPALLESKDKVIKELAVRGEYDSLCRDYGFRYFIVPSEKAFPSLLASVVRVLFRDSKTLVLESTHPENCHSS